MYSGKTAKLTFTFGKTDSWLKNSTTFFQPSDQKVFFEPPNDFAFAFFTVGGKWSLNDKGTKTPRPPCDKILTEQLQPDWKPKTQLSNQLHRCFQDGHYSFCRVFGKIVALQTCVDLIVQEKKEQMCEDPLAHRRTMTDSGQNCIKPTYGFYPSFPSP